MVSDVARFNDINQYQILCVCCHFMTAFTMWQHHKNREKIIEIPKMFNNKPLLDNKICFVKNERNSEQGCQIYQKFKEYSSNSCRRPIESNVL